jgi:hypothetical protein
VQRRHVDLPRTCRRPVSLLREIGRSKGLRGLKALRKPLHDRVERVRIQGRLAQTEFLRQSAQGPEARLQAATHIVAAQGRNRRPQGSEPLHRKQVAAEDVLADRQPKVGERTFALPQTERCRTFLFQLVL